MDTLIRNTPSRVARTAVLGTVAGVLFANLGTAVAGPNEIATRMHNRIAGVPPSPTVLQQMVTAMGGTPSPGSLAAAALIATQNPNFYNVQLKTFVTPWTNRDQTVFAPLNDYTATVIGMVRDDLDFSTVLSDDILYTINSSGLPAPSASGNDHYATAETNGVDLSTTLKRTTQSGTYGFPAAATAGLMTTRGGSSAFFVAGTNRAMFRFTMINHLCHDMEAVQDTTRPSDRIRQDVARSPGGDSRIFLNNCVGCHSGMDPMAQAFAYYNFDATAGALQYTANIVQPKYLINSDNFKPGFVTPNDAWENRWRSGPNAVLGFSSSLPGSGNGAKSLGQELAASDAFAQCQVEKVFKAVCFRAPQTSGDLAAIAATKANFKNGYNLRKVFAATAAYCSGS